MSIQTNLAEPSSPNAHTDFTCNQEQQQLSSISRSIEEMNSDRNETLLNEKKTLKRHLGLFSGISFILGMIIGSGIFISPKGVLKETESIGLCLVVWVLCGLISILGALCYAEIGTVIPLSGSELAYMREGTANNPLRISLAFYSGLWAYGGWASLNSVTEELKNPKRNLWLSIVVALSSVIVLYLLTNISYFTVMNTAELLRSDAVAMTWGETVLGPAVRALTILVSFSALGSANATIYASGRYFMVGARYGYLPEIFSCIQKQRLTPLPSIVLMTILSIIYCIPSNIGNLIGFVSFVSWMFFGLTFLATIFCKFTKAKADRVIKVPIPVIIFMILVSIYLVIAPVISSPNIGYLVAIIILLIGLVFYYLFVFRKIQLKGMKKINMFLLELLHLTMSTVNTEE
ncbi:unnamed protein product [Rotaria magnacalcarata]